MDLVVRLDRLPRLGETIIGSDLMLFPGGKGANQACAAARLGGSTTMIGMVGNDEFGLTLRTNLAEAGVQTERLSTSHRATGCATISVLPDGENMIVLSPGANAALTPDVVSENADLFSPDELLLAQLEIPLEVIEEAFAKAAAAGMLTILDPAPALPLSPDLLRKVDYLTPNQSEAAVLLGDPALEITTEKSAAEAADALLSLGPRGVILKLGALGCFAACGRTRALVRGFEVQALDTTAAGDVFNGAFAVSLCKGASLLEAVQFANAAAAISVTRRGAQSSIPSRSEIEEFLRLAPNHAAALGLGD